MPDNRIDAPGAGQWIMERAEGYFRDGWDHAFSAHDGDIILGGIALIGYLGASMTLHMAGEGRWFNRELAWLVFHYAFEQLKLKKLLAPVRSDNHVVISINMRGGWQFDAVIKDAFQDADMVVLSMTRDTCPWLEHHPRHWKPA